jgi:hypothetical protein
MNKLLALSSAAMLALAPAIAAAESPLTLNSTKSSGNLDAGVGDDVVIVDAPAPAGINPLLLAGAGLLVVGLIVASDDDDDDTTTTSN